MQGNQALLLLVRQVFVTWRHCHTELHAELLPHVADQVWLHSLRCFQPHRNEKALQTCHTLLGWIPESYSLLLTSTAINNNADLPQ
jgi:hypothetical protein